MVIIGKRNIKEVIKLKKIYFLFALTVILISSVIVFGFVNNKSVVVSGTPVKEEDLILNVETTGIIEENGIEKIYAPEDDFVTDILVKEGQKVEKNEALANLYSGNALRSTIDGYVKLVNNSENPLAKSNSPIFVLCENTSFLLKLSVDERDIYKIDVGNDVEVTCVAVPGKTYQGKVSEISSIAKQQTGLRENSAVIDVTVEFFGDTSGIRTGYTANANIMGIKNENVITVPFEAIIQKNGESFVWLAKDNKVVMQKVETGLETDFDTQILSGIEKGDIVILNPTWNSNSKIIIK